MTDKELWKEYIFQNPCYKHKNYESWCYGSDTPDLLAELTVNGIKTATASAFLFYEYENCDLPRAGDFSIVLNTSNEALCMIKITSVNVVPFLEVSEEQARKEGEGDKSLRYWREVHKTAFDTELLEIGQSFSEDMLVVCEEFEVVFRASDASSIV